MMSLADIISGNVHKLYVNERRRGCTEKRQRRKQTKVTTTNAIYRCEELEEADSVYDHIAEDKYDELNENTIYLDIIGDETADECDPECKPRLPSPRPVSESPDQNTDHGYEGLAEDMPDHMYHSVLHDKREECDQDAQAQDSAQD